MQMRKIGSLDVSVVGLGCNNFGWRVDQQGTDAVVNAAIDAGINFFDTAEIYGEGSSETLLGRALGPRRSSVIVATKFGHDKNSSPAAIRNAVEGSLKRLGTDYIDLYQQHNADPNTPIGEILGVLDDLVRAGKVREIGCSNFSAPQLQQAAAAAAPGKARYVSVQNHYSLLYRAPEAEVLPECVREGLAFLPYFPLENGLLTGQYRQGRPHPKGSRGDTSWGPKVFTDENLAIVERLIQFAETYHRTILELAMSWLASRPCVASIISGASKPEQVRQNAAAVDFAFVPELLEEIDRIVLH